MAIVIKGEIKVKMNVPLKTTNSGLDIQHLSASYTKRLEPVVNMYKPIDLPKKYDTFASDPKLASAAYLTKTIHESGNWIRPNNRIEKEAIAKDIVSKEQIELLDWARRKNLFIEPTEFEKKWQEQGMIAGAEQQVVINDATVTKRKMLWPDETWLDYFNRLSAHRELSPESSYAFLGFTEAKIGNRTVTMAMTEQNFVTGRSALPHEVDTYMFEKDFVKIPNTSGNENLQEWLDPKSGVVVSDLSAANVVRTANGGTVIIDPQIEFLLPDVVNNIMENKDVKYEITLLSHDPINDKYIEFGFSDYFVNELKQAGINQLEPTSKITVSKTEYERLYPLLQKKVSFMDVDKQHKDPKDNVYYIVTNQVLQDNG